MTLQEQLVAARVAYHNLVTGGMPRVIVDQNGERVEFTAAKKTDLYAYIQELEGQVNPGVVGVTRGPLTFVF